MRWNHVLRQSLFQVHSQLVAVRRLVHDHVSHQPLVSRRILSGNHHYFTHCRVSAQHSLNLSQLDAEPSDFDLLITSTEEREVAVSQVPNQISRPVKPRALLVAEWIRHKSFSRLLRSAPVTA